MVDSGASGHYFDDALIPESRYRLDNYQELAIRRWITTAGGHQLKEAGQGLLSGHSIGAQGLKHLIQLSVLAGPDVGPDLFSIKQDSALSGGESLSGTPKGGKPRGEQPASLGEASPAGGVPQNGVLGHPEQSMSPGCEHMEAPLTGPLPLQHHGPSRHQVTPAAGQAAQRSPSESVTTTTLLISWRSPPTARCPSFGGSGYTPRRSLQILRTSLMKRSRLWNMPVPRPIFKCIRRGRKRK